MPNDRPYGDGAALSAIEAQRLRWRCRRGLLELDLLLQAFYDKRYDNLSSVQQTAFKRLLEQDDPSLLAWIVGKKGASDPELDVVCRLIIEHNYTLSRNKQE